MRTITYYTVLKTTVITALGLSDVQDIKWDNVNLVFRHSDIITNNNPLPGITRVQEKYTVIAWDIIYNQFFSSIPKTKFRNMNVTIGETEIKVNLNLEE